MTVCKRPVRLDHRLQEAGPSFWQLQKGHQKCIFETLHNCVLSVKEANFNGKTIKIFTFVYGQGRGGWSPPPLTVSLTLKYPIFFDESPKGTRKILLNGFFLFRGALDPPMFSRRKKIRKGGWGWEEEEEKRSISPDVWSLREGWRYQIGWIFGKNWNRINPSHSFLENFVAIFL